MTRCGRYAKVPLTRGEWTEQRLIAAANNPEPPPAFRFDSLATKPQTPRPPPPAAYVVPRECRPRPKKKESPLSCLLDPRGRAFGDGSSSFYYIRLKRKFFFFSFSSFCISI